MVFTNRRAFLAMAAAGIVAAPLARAQGPAQSATGGQILDDQALIDDIKAEANALVVGQITQAQVDELRADVGLLVPDLLQLLVNASFETPLQRGAFTYNPTGTGIGWTFSPNSGIAGNGSQFGAATAPEGVQVGFVQGASAISQTLSLNAGSHTLSFMASARYAHAQPLKVMLDGFQIGALVAPTSTAWALFSIPFSVATSGTHALAFVGTQAVNKTTFIDAVAIQ
ncbi:MAG: hypothetical protein E6H78_15370 [Betaproteobacteria bacterium]|nr:MAG: hypothetical protein E6H78_15370 [Betaproteobacteria bacterium]